MLGYPFDPAWGKEVKQTVDDIQMVWVEELKKREGVEMEEVAGKEVAVEEAEAPAEGAVAEKPIKLSKFHVGLLEHAWLMAATREDAEIEDNKKAVWRGQYQKIIKSFADQNYPGLDLQWLRYQWDKLKKEGVIGAAKDKIGKARVYYIPDPDQLSIEIIDNPPELEERLKSLAKPLAGVVPEEVVPKVPAPEAIAARPAEIAVGSWEERFIQQNEQVIDLLQKEIEKTEKRLGTLRQLLASRLKEMEILKLGF